MPKLRVMSDDDDNMMDAKAKEHRRHKAKKEQVQLEAEQKRQEERRHEAEKAAEAARVEADRVERQRVVEEIAAEATRKRAWVKSGPMSSVKAR